MIINNNIPALNTHRMLTQNNFAGQQSMEKLSSGLRINRAGDDAAGLAISEKMRGQIRGLEQATRNAQDGISLIQTAEGALNETHSILQRMRELAVQSANDTNTPEDRAELQKEVDQLAQEISRIAENTEFNTQNLLNGELQSKFQIGANEGQNIELSIGDMGAEALSVIGISSDPVEIGELEITNKTLEDVTITYVAADSETDETTVSVTDNAITVTLAVDDEDNITATEQDVLDALQGDADASALISVQAQEDADLTENASAVSETNIGAGEIDETKGIDISSQSAADAAITTINDAIEDVSAQRSELGAVQNRLEHTINNLGTSAENLQAAESRIRDVDYAPAA